MELRLLPCISTRFFSKAYWSPVAILFALLLSTAAHSADFKLSDHTLTVPDGFKVELIGAPPLVDRPIYGAFDEEGRLYVVDSSGSNDKPDKQLEDKPHRVVRLEDTNGDGC